MAKPAGLEPEFVIGREQRDAGDVLRADDLARVAGVLLSEGFVLLPSDTAFSVAAIPFSGAVRTRINTLLDRPDVAISLAFPSVSATSRWIAPNPMASLLLRKYCPGPITVVCPAAPDLPDQLFEQVMASRNRSLGVRVPDSVVERQVAGVTAYPITTVAVRDRDHDPDPVTTLPEALAVVRIGLIASGFARWCVIDGEVRHDRHSTVVEVASGDGQIELNRIGAIPFEEIQETVSTARWNTGLQG